MRKIGNPNQLPSGASSQEGPLTEPRSCAVIPHRTEDPEGFIETRNECKCGRPVIISIAAVREMARMIDLVSKEEVDAIRNRVREAERKLETWHQLGEAIEAKERLEKEMVA